MHHDNQLRVAGNGASATTSRSSWRLIGAAVVVIGQGYAVGCHPRSHLPIYLLIVLDLSGRFISVVLTYDSPVKLRTLQCALPSPGA
jgi:hypothetical protein